VAAWLGDDQKVFTHFPWFLYQGRPFPSVRKDLIEFLYVQQSKIVNAAAMVRMSLVRDAGLRCRRRACRLALIFVGTRWMGVVGVLVFMAR
jgi:hypothetical protein